MEENQSTTDSTVNENKLQNGNISRVIIGLTELGNLDIEDFKMNYSITKTIATLSVMEKAYNKSLQSLMKKYIQKDEKGNYMSEGNFYLFESTETKEEYQKQTEVLNESYVEGKIFTFKASDLQKIKGVKGTVMAKFHELIIDDVVVK